MAHGGGALRAEASPRETRQTPPEGGSVGRERRLVGEGFHFPKSHVSAAAFPASVGHWPRPQDSE